MPDTTPAKPCKVAVIWIDWYAYHVARFRGLHENPALSGRVRGIELVGGVGVHQGLKFREDLPAGLPIETLMPQSSWQAAGQFTLARKLWAALTRIDPQAVLVPGYYTLPALAAALWAKLHRRQSILMTESTAADHIRAAWKEALKGALIRTLFDAAVCGGSAHLRYLSQLGFPVDRVAFAYDVVDNDYFANSAASLRAQNNRPPNLPESYFLYVGRLSPEKNLDGLIHSFANYRKQGGVSSLVLVGAGPSEPQLRELASGLSLLPNIYFAGKKNYTELPPYYAFAKCFILPSTREPWGLVVNEAMASSLTCVVSAHCGCAESLIEHQRTGFVFDPAVESSLASSLILIDALTPEELTRLGNNARLHIGNYSPTLFGKEIENILVETRP